MFNNVLQFVRVGPQEGTATTTGKNSTLKPKTVHSPQWTIPREKFIDLTRGLLLLLMINSHALFLAGVSGSNFWNPLLWFPRGWATQCFVILSGFSMGYIYAQTHRGIAESQRRLFQRGKEIFLVMFVSNIVFLAMKHYLNGNASLLSSLEWWQGLLTFHTPYSISAILIPTALLAFLMPLLLYGHAKGFTKIVLLTTIAASFFIAGGQDTLAAHLQVYHLFKVKLTPDGSMELNILRLLGYGLIGCSIGMIWKQHSSIPIIVTIVASICFLGYLTLAPIYQHQILNISKAALGGPVKFCLILAVGWLLTYSLGTSPVGRYLVLIGKYSLFCFLTHRIVLHGLLIPLQSTFPPAPEILFSILFFGTLMMLGGLCWGRKHSPIFSNFLKKAYL